jgi:hypothetical protein
MDDTKRKLAAKVQSLIKDTDWNQVIEPIGNRPNTSSIISNLQTMIYIRTPAGPRQFLVIVKEVM